MPSLYLIRHGESQANVDGLLAGRTPGIALTDRGRGQALALGEALSEVPFELVVSSPLQRCLETREAIFGVDTEVLQDESLTEVDYGAWSGEPLATLAKDPLWATVQQQPSRMTFPGGENLGDMSRRVVGAVRTLDAEVSREFSEQSVWAAVTHGDVIKAVVADALGMHLDAFQRIAVAPASLSIIHYGAGGVMVQAVGMTTGRLPALPGKSSVGGGNESPAPRHRDPQAFAGAQAGRARDSRAGGRYTASDGARLGGDSFAGDAVGTSHDGGAGVGGGTGRHASDGGGRRPRH